MNMIYIYIYIYIYICRLSTSFQSINRNKVTDSLNGYNIPSKLIKLIVLTLMGTSAIVKINNEFTGKF